MDRAVVHIGMGPDEVRCTRWVSTRDRFSIQERARADRAGPGVDDDRLGIGYDCRCAVHFGGQDFDGVSEFFRGGLMAGRHGLDIVLFPGRDFPGDFGQARGHVSVKFGLVGVTILEGYK